MDTATLLISADQAAKLLSTTRRRVLRMVREGRIPHVELGDGEPRFSPSELRTWIASLSHGERREVRSHA